MVTDGWKAILAIHQTLVIAMRRIREKLASFNAKCLSTQLGNKCHQHDNGWGAWHVVLADTQLYVSPARPVVPPGNGLSSLSRYYVCRHNIKDR